MAAAGGGGGRRRRQRRRAVMGGGWVGLTWLGLVWFGLENLTADGGGGGLCCRQHQEKWNMCQTMRKHRVWRRRRRKNAKCHLKHEEG
eukprot:gene22412-biopygen14772